MYDKPSMSISYVSLVAKQTEQASPMGVRHQPSSTKPDYPASSGAGTSFYLLLSIHQILD